MYLYNIILIEDVCSTRNRYTPIDPDEHESYGKRIND